MKLLDKKGQVGGLQVFILGIVGVTITLVVGLIVLTELQSAAKTSAGDTTKASNATGTILDKMVTIPTWIGIVIVVAMAFIVLGFFYKQGMNQ